jgi:hypothetical protein
MERYVLTVYDKGKDYPKQERPMLILLKKELEFVRKSLDVSR